jgi:hypothetical protein
MARHVVSFFVSASLCLCLSFSVFVFVSMSPLLPLSFSPFHFVTLYSLVSSGSLSLSLSLPPSPFLTSIQVPSFMPAPHLASHASTDAEHWARSKLAAEHAIKSILSRSQGKRERERERERKGEKKLRQEWNERRKKRTREGGEEERKYSKRTKEKVKV